jgi:hypothetical protein
MEFVILISSHCVSLTYHGQEPQGDFAYLNK